MQTKWDLETLYGVTGIDDARIEKYVAKEKRAMNAFAKTYTNQTAYLKSPTQLKKALDAYTKLDSGKSLLVYLYLKKYLDSNDTAITALVNKYQQELVTYANKLVFFDLALGNIPKQTQQKLLKAPQLKEYRYMLEKVFENAKYNLSQKEEELLNLLGMPSGSMWVDGVQKLLNKQMVSYDDGEIPITEALMKFGTLPTRERRALWKEIRETLKDEVADFAESEINALFTKKKVTDNLRGLSKPYSATVIGYENTEKSVEALVEAVSDSFSVAHKYFRIKKRLLGFKELQYVDRGADIGKIDQTFDFKTSYDKVHDAFSHFGGEYAEILETMVTNGQIDVHSRKGKSGGAFCYGAVDNPTFVLLNHTDDFKSMMTLAHEMGHAIHSELSKSQSSHYQQYTTSVAETASTFFEHVVFDHVFEDLSEKEQIVALHDKIGNAIATVFRQIACFNFEKELHERVREEGFVSKEDMAALLNKHMQSYVGKDVAIHEDDGYFFTAWSHIRRPFYVYSYAYGELISAALYEHYKKDSSFGDKVKLFLSAGGSMAPDDIFKMIGIDTTKPQFFKDGIAAIKKDIAQLDRLTKK